MLFPNVSELELDKCAISAGNFKTLSRHNIFPFLHEIYFSSCGILSTKFFKHFVRNRKNVKNWWFYYNSLSAFTLSNLFQILSETDAIKNLYVWEDNEFASKSEKEKILHGLEGLL
eukprot:snap_masked-scaffold_14-processed-gene-4.37-mRNA-1 protein AED:1.00 eAED:1.00 QI:0/0/0/0/1/1/6/0/115